MTHDAENQVSRPSISCSILVFHIALAAKIVTSPDSIALYSMQHACGATLFINLQCSTAEYIVIFGFLGQMGAPLGINY